MPTFASFVNRRCSSIPYQLLRRNSSSNRLIILFVLKYETLNNHSCRRIVGVSIDTFLVANENRSTVTLVTIFVLTCVIKVPFKRSVWESHLFYYILLRRISWIYTKDKEIYIDGWTAPEKSRSRRIEDLLSRFEIQIGPCRWPDNI